MFSRAPFCLIKIVPRLGWSNVADSRYLWLGARSLQVSCDKASDTLECLLSCEHTCDRWWLVRLSSNAYGRQAGEPAPLCHIARTDLSRSCASRNLHFSAASGKGSRVGVTVAAMSRPRVSEPPVATVCDGRGFLKGSQSMLCYANCWRPRRRLGTQWVLGAISFLKYRSLSTD